MRLMDSLLRPKESEENACKQETYTWKLRKRRILLIETEFDLKDMNNFLVKINVCQTVSS